MLWRPTQRVIWCQITSTCSVKLFIIFPNLLFIVVLKPERMRPRTRLRHILCDNTKMDSKMNHPRCVYVNNRCKYQSITQQYLKRCLIKDDNNYTFRPIATIIKFSSESMFVVLYRIGMVMSRWWDLNICDVCYMLLLWGTGGGYLWCALSWGVQLKYVCSLLSCVSLQLLFVYFRFG